MISAAHLMLINSAIIEIVEIKITEELVFEVNQKYFDQMLNIFFIY
jgi:glucose-6-phosphate 1-dehydrogenase